MHFTAITLGMLSAAAGLVAAWFWYQCSLVRPIPVWPNAAATVPDGGDVTALMMGGTAVLVALTEAGRLNGIAARWIAASVLLGVFSNTIGCYQ